MLIDKYLYSSFPYKRKDLLDNNIINVHYDRLLYLINNKQLIKGSWYKIVDFATVHYMLDDDAATTDINTGPNEPLLVFAISNSEISHEVKSELHPHDVIHYDWNPANWVKDISFGDDTTIIAGWTGVIYWRHYTLNDISAPGDWRYVKSRRWALAAAPEGFDTAYVAISSTAEGVVDVNDYNDYLMFECSLTDTLEDRVAGVTIKPFRDRTDLGYWYPTILTNNVFHGIDGAGWWQIYGFRADEMCYYNTFGGYMESNVVGGSFSKNIIGSNFYANTIGSSFYINTIGNSFNSNTTGSYFYSNIIGNSFNSSAVGDDFHSNTIGDSFSINTIGADFNTNTIGSNFSTNTIGSSFSINTIGNNFISNTIGNSFISNTIGNIFITNTIGNSFSSNTIGDSFQLNSGSCNNADFTLSTHVYGNYSCELFKRLDGAFKLGYIDNTDTMLIVDIDD